MTEEPLPSTTPLEGGAPIDPMDRAATPATPGAGTPLAPAAAVDIPTAPPVATLRLVGGAGRVEIRSDPSLTELYRARFEPNTPEVVVEGDRVTVRYALHRLLGRFATTEETTSRFALSTGKPWDISAPDGVTALDADLATARITALRVSHGGGTVRLRLGRPVGTIPVAIAGGAREVIVFRPEGVMVRVATQGDVARVIIDSGRPIGPLTGNTTVEPPGYALSEDRYDISVGGACESVLVTTEPAAAS